MKSISQQIVVHIATMVFVWLCGCEAVGQVRQPRLEDRQAALRGLRRDIPERRQLSQKEWQKVANDFKELQVAVNKLHTSIGVAPLDYRIVKISAGEILKRAKSLKEELRLPQPENQPRTGRKEPSSDALPSLIGELITRVDAFLTNPMFDNVHVFDVQNATAAGADMQAIVDLSKQIRKLAKALGNPAVQD